MSYRPRYLIEFVPYTYFVANKKMVSNTYIVNAHFITTFIVLTRKSLPRTFNVTFESGNSVFSKCLDTLQWIFGGPNDTHILYSKRFIMHTYVSFPGRLFLINRRKIDSKYIHFVASTFIYMGQILTMTGTYPGQGKNILSKCTLCMYFPALTSHCRFLF